MSIMRTCVMCEKGVNTRTQPFLSFPCPAPCKGLAHWHCLPHYVESASAHCPMCQCVPPPRKTIIKDAVLNIDATIPYTRLQPFITAVVTKCVEEDIHTETAKALRNAMRSPSATRSHNKHIELFSALVGAMTLAELAKVCTPESVADSHIPPIDFVMATCDPTPNAALKLFGLQAMLTKLPVELLRDLGITPKWLLKNGVDGVVAAAPLPTLVALNLTPALMIQHGISAGAIESSPSPLRVWLDNGLTVQHMAIVNMHYAPETPWGRVLDRDPQLRVLAYEKGVLLYL